MKETVPIGFWFSFWIKQFGILVEIGFGFVAGKNKPMGAIEWHLRKKLISAEMNRRAVRERERQKRKKYIEKREEMEREKNKW